MLNNLLDEYKVRSEPFVVDYRGDVKKCELGVASYLFINCHEMLGLGNIPPRPPGFTLEQVSDLEATLKIQEKILNSLRQHHEKNFLSSSNNNSDSVTLNQYINEYENECKNYRFTLNKKQEQIKNVLSVLYSDIQGIVRKKLMEANDISNISDLQSLSKESVTCCENVISNFLAWFNNHSAIDLPVNLPNSSHQLPPTLKLIYDLRLKQILFQHLINRCTLSRAIMASSPVP